MLNIDDKTKESLEKKHYKIAGGHSAVQICSWNKKALLKDPKKRTGCYKEKFYGVNTHKCSQMSPAAIWCPQNCIFCWRPAEYMHTREIKKGDVEEPEKIIEEIVKQRKKLLSGFGGSDVYDKKIIQDAMIPDHWAISLSGEPTMYPKILELIKELKKPARKNRTVFLVTNAYSPKVFKKMIEKDIYPTQLYVSVEACTKELFEEINRSSLPNGWDDFNKSLDAIKKLPCRKVMRLTVIKGVNDSPEFMKGFAEIANKGLFDFVEVKSYMWLGYSRKRLEMENMPLHSEIEEYSENLLGFLSDYVFCDEHPPSRIVLLRRKDSKFSPKIDVLKDNDTYKTITKK